MNAAAQVHWFAAAALERLLFSLAEGTALAFLVSAVLRFAPAGDSRTRFRLWFSALLATAALPLLTVFWKPVSIAGSTRPLLSVSFSVAEYIVLAWLLLAAGGVIRVVTALGQVRKLRNRCRPMDPQALGEELARHVEEFRKLRPVSLLVAEHAHVPAAIGFFKPAIVIPAWLVEEGPSAELKHVVLHELAHLRRYDDWTNLAEQILKAVLFFHPAVWWMRRNLVLDREMACDDAVLAQTSDPRAYAQSLARVAEKSFLRRQLALAQAAVSRVRQLSRRVARILDANSPPATRAWKTAVPVVAAMAVVCGASLAWIPGMVQVGSTPAASMAAQTSGGLAHEVHQLPAADVRAIPAKLTLTDHHGVALKRTPAAQQRLVPAKAVPAKVRHPQQPLRQAEHRDVAVEPPLVAALGDEAALPASQEDQDGYVLVVASRQTVISGPEGVQVRVVQVQMLIPASEFRKQVPRKT